MMSLEGPLNAALEVPSRALATASKWPQAAFSLQLELSLLQDRWRPCTILQERSQDYLSHVMTTGAQWT